MVSFAQPLFWQIKYIVSALTKKNWKPSLNELHNLVAAFGYDGQVYFLRVLLEDAALTNWQSSGKGSLQLQALSQELKEIENEEQFGQLLCHAIEQFKESFSEDFLSQMSKATKISLQAQINMAVAMLQSLPLSQETSRRESAKFLRNRFREFFSNRQVRLSEPLVHSLLALLKGCPNSEVQEVFEEKERDQFFKQLLDHHPEIDTTKGPLAGLLVLYKMRESRLKQPHARKVIEVPILASGDKFQGYHDGVRACDLVEELGHHGGSSSAQAIKETLKLEFPHLDKRGVAEVIAVTLHLTLDPKVDPHAGLVSTCAKMAARSKEGVNQWNCPEMSQQMGANAASPTAVEALPVDQIIDFLKGMVKNGKKDWEEVFSLMFDLPELRLPNKKAVEALLQAFKHVQPKGDFPLEAVLRLRRNTTAQLQFIRHAVSGLSTTLSWYEHKQLEPIMGLPGAEGTQGTAGPGNCWTCLKLLEVLFELAEVEDYSVVQKLFQVAYQLRPHAMLVSCCLAEDRSRGTMRADILEKLAPALFEPGGGPNALLATVALAQRQPKGLKKLLRAMLDKDPHQNLQKILNLLMNENLKLFYADLLAEVPSELVVRLVLASQTQPKEENVVNLPDWLSKVLAQHKDRAAESLVHFLRSRFMSEVAGQPLTTFKPPPPLPASLDEADICRTFLHALNQALEVLSPDVTRQVRELETLVHHRHPSLAPAAASRPPETLPPPQSESPKLVPPPSAPPPAPTSPGAATQLPPAPPAAPPAAQAAVPPNAPMMAPPRAEPPAAAAPAAAQAAPAPAQAAAARQPEPQNPQKLEKEAEAIIKSLISDKVRTPQELNKLLQEYSQKEERHHYKQLYAKTMELIWDGMENWYMLPCEAAMLATQMISCLLDAGTFGQLELPVLKYIMEHLRNPVAKEDLNFQLTIINTLLDRLPKFPYLCSELARIHQLAAQLPPLQSYVHYATSILELTPQEYRNRPSLKLEEMQRWPQFVSGNLPRAPRERLCVYVYEPTHKEWVPGPLLQYMEEPRRPAEAKAAMRNPPAMPPPPKAMNPQPRAGGGGLLSVDQLLAEPEIAFPTPSQSVQDAVASVFNSLSHDNIPEKVEQLQRSVTPNDYGWLCYHTVSRRAAREANFHGTYITFFNACRDKKALFQRLIIMTFECLRLMMKAVDEIVNSSNHRTVLKSLGTWLGLITVGRDYPLKSKSMDIKDLLLDAYENGRLTAVLPMACKILEAVERSKAFKLPCPWTVGLLSLVAEIHAVPHLKTNLAFEVEVLFRHLEIDVNSWPKQDLLRTRRPPQGGPDLGKSAQEPPQEMQAAMQRPAAYWTQQGDPRQEAEYHHRAYVQQQQAYQMREQADRHARAVPQPVAHAVHEENYITHLLPQLVVVPRDFEIFRQRPKLVRWLTTAVDSAVKEVLSAVEHSIRIACYSSAQMAMKDFIYEVEDDLLRKASTYMAVAVSGSLALVMCRDPLEKALKSQLMSIFMQQVNTKDLTLRDADTMEKFINVLAEKNMDLCSILVEKYVTDKAVADVETMITQSVEFRVEHKARYNGNMFCDSNAPQSAWLQQIPENLRQSFGSLSPMFLKIYKDFHTHYAAYVARVPRGLERETLNFQPPRYMQPLQDQHCYAFQKQKLLREKQLTAARGRRPEDMAAMTAAASSAASVAAASAAASAAAAPPAAPAPSAMEQRQASAQLKEMAGQIVQKLQLHIEHLQQQPLRLSSLTAINLPLHCTDDTLEAVAALMNLQPEVELRKLMRGIKRWAGNVHGASLSQANDEVFCQMVKKVFQMLQGQFKKPEMMQTRPDCVSVLHVVTEVLLCTLDYLGGANAPPHYKKQLQDTLLQRLEDMELNGLQQLDVVAGTLRYRLVSVSDLDRIMSRWMDARARAGPNPQSHLQSLDFVILVLQRCCMEHRTHFGKDFQKCGEIITKQAERRRRMNQQQQNAMQPQELQLLSQAERFVENLNAQSAQGEEEFSPLNSRPPRLMVTAIWNAKETEDKPPKAQFDADSVGKLLHEWNSVLQANGRDPPSVDHLTQDGNRRVQGSLNRIQGLLFSSTHFNEDTLELFFKYGVEYTVKCTQVELDKGDIPEKARKTAMPEMGIVDGFTHLLWMLMKKQPENANRLFEWPVNYNQHSVVLLKSALQAIHKALTAAAKGQPEEFNQRIWQRILMNIVQDTSTCTTDVYWKILQLISDTYLALNPMRVPNFCFAWLDLISHKLFMTRILNIPNRRGWLLFQRIFMGLLTFIGPYLARIRMSDLIRNLYKCTLRTLLALLYDFPEFLSEYHMVFCDVIPWQCVQIRNLILAAFPSSMKLPDPFTHSLKVDTLPEMKVCPTIQSTYLTKLMICGLKADVDNWIRTGEIAILDSIVRKLQYSDPAVALEAGTKYNVPLLNATILYAGANCLFLKQQDHPSPSLTFFEFLLETFDTEGRFWMFTTFANHLRFPNMHTYCFSCIILWLFSNTRIQEVREQITRVLLERLIVHRPHPWGLLITFIELIKNRHYQFWGFDFVKSDQQLQKLFTSVAFTCLGHPVPTDGEPVDTPEAQLNYLKAYKFNEPVHQQYRQQQIDQQTAQLRAHQAHQAQQAAAVLQAQAAPPAVPVPAAAVPAAPLAVPQQAPPAAQPPAQAPPAPQMPGRPQEAVPQAAPKAKAIPPNVNTSGAKPPPAQPPPMPP